MTDVIDMKKCIFPIEALKFKNGSELIPTTVVVCLWYGRHAYL